jgi:hypothetical protein
MYDNSNYPLGADTPYAPWNEQEVPERQFDVCISQTLSKSTRVTTNDYVPEVDQDEDGVYESTDTSDTDWKEAYKNEHLTPLQLIGEFKDFLTKHLPDPIIDVKGFRRFKYLIGECEGWTEDETEVVED